MKETTVPCPPHGSSVAPTLLAATLLAMLAACAGPSARMEPTAAGRALVARAATSQPANVGDAKRTARAYHDSGAYDRDLAAVVTEARDWVSERAPQVGRPGRGSEPGHT